ncbi:MAG TPA: hypothetical protein VJI67_03895 [archaeon]|nr:hypothetical protein [archaeon]HLD80448.1 hypothetical protein [archaeon]
MRRSISGPVIRPREAKTMLRRLNATKGRVSVNVLRDSIKYAEAGTRNPKTSHETRALLNSFLRQARFLSSFKK